MSVHRRLVTPRCPATTAVSRDDCAGTALVEALAALVLVALAAALVASAAAASLRAVRRAARVEQLVAAAAADLAALQARRGVVAGRTVQPETSLGAAAVSDVTVDAAANVTRLRVVVRDEPDGPAVALATHVVASPP